MSTLILAAAVFLAIHFLIAGTRIRDGITSAIGERPYLGLFSLASLAAIVWFVVAFNSAHASGANRQLFDLGVGIRHLGIPVIALAFLLGVQGLLVANPTSIQQEGAAAKDDTIKGVLRITRHPFLWGVAIWSAFPSKTFTKWLEVVGTVKLMRTTPTTPGGPRYYIWLAKRAPARISR